MDDLHCACRKNKLLDYKSQDIRLCNSSHHELWDSSGIVLAKMHLCYQARRLLKFRNSNDKVLLQHKQMHVT